ncbi:DUF6498-containing protein [Kangiella marina]|uniref:Uncharacterized protein n=1 Tax=Kangiella marina TaxID=1079178 RepID=A0ABP8INB3_9GAMM
MELEQSNNAKLSKGKIAVALANIVPLIGVLLGYWSAFDIIFLYWFENIIIGIFTFCRMTIRPDTPPMFRFGGLFMAAFFCVHYGFFTFGHGSFVASFFDEQLLGANAAMSGNIFNVTGFMLSQQGIQLTIFAMLIAHLVEFILAYRNREFDSIPAEMFRPYKRIIVLHIAIIAGGFIATLFENTLGVALVMIALKIYFDLRPNSFSKLKEKHKGKLFDTNISDEEAKEKIRQSLLKPEIKINGETHQFDSVEEMVNSDLYQKHSKWLRWLLPKKHLVLYEEVINECIKNERESLAAKEPKEIKTT